MQYQILRNNEEQLGIVSLQDGTIVVKGDNLQQVQALKKVIEQIEIHGLSHRSSRQVHDTIIEETSIKTDKDEQYLRFVIEALVLRGFLAIKID